MIPHCSAEEIESQSVGSFLHTRLPLGGAEMVESLREQRLDWD